MTRMPLSLNNAAYMLQCMMEMALQGLQWIMCLININDIIVFGKKFEEHINRVEEVLERIEAAGLKLNLSSVYFYNRQCFSWPCCV